MAEPEKIKLEAIHKAMAGSSFREGRGRVFVLSMSSSISLS
jgi:hypothetical protein